MSIFPATHVRHRSFLLMEEQRDNDRLKSLSKRAEPVRNEGKSHETYSEAPSDFACSMSPEVVQFAVDRPCKSSLVWVVARSGLVHRFLPQPEIRRQGPSQRATALPHPP